MRSALCFAFAIASLCPAPDAIAQNKAAAIERLARRYVELGRLNGTLLVAEQGKVLFSRGYGYAGMEWKVPNGSDTRFRIADVTKPFTALLIMQLVEEGKLSLDTTLSALLPFYREDTGSRITVRHLLSHSSGIPDSVRLHGFQTSTMREPVEGTTPFILRYCSGDLEFEPGSGFAYSNSGYFILGAIIEAVAGRPYAEVLRSKIFLPAGMTASGVDRTGLLLPKRASGYERLLDGTYIPAPCWDPGRAYAAGAIYSTVDDLLKFDRAFTAGRLLSPAGITAMITPVKPASGQWTGLGWMIARMPLAGRSDTLTLMQHRGDVHGTTAFFSHSLLKDQTVVLLCNVGGEPVQDIVNGIFNLLNNVAPELNPNHMSGRKKLADLGAPVQESPQPE